MKYSEICLKYGTGAAQKTVFSGKLLQFPGSFRRNVIKPPLMNRNSNSEVENNEKILMENVIHVFIYIV